MRFGDEVLLVLVRGYLDLEVGFLGLDQHLGVVVGVPLLEVDIVAYEVVEELLLLELVEFREVDFLHNGIITITLTITTFISAKMHFHQGSNQGEAVLYLNPLRIPGRGDRPEEGLEASPQPYLQSK